MSEPAPPFEIRTIPIALIDPPELAVREIIDDAALEGLVSSLQRHGQLQNIGVVSAGDRYRVAYGHRRRLAAERAGLAVLVARVFPEGTTDEEAIKVDENAEQEPVNAAAEATYYRFLLDERCNGELERLLRLVRRKESFVLERLDLTRGDPAVLEALRQDRIAINVAKELNKVRDAMYRALYLHDAITQGLNARAIRVLREDLDRHRHMREAAAAGSVPTIEPSTAQTIAHMDACVLCHATTDTHEMMYVKAHQSCLAVWYREAAEKRK